MTHDEAARIEEELNRDYGHVVEARVIEVPQAPGGWATCAALVGQPGVFMDTYTMLWYGHWYPSGAGETEWGMMMRGDFDSIRVCKSIREAVPRPSLDALRAEALAIVREEGLA